MLNWFLIDFILMEINSRIVRGYLILEIEKSRVCDEKLVKFLCKNRFCEYEQRH